MTASPVSPAKLNLRRTQLPRRFENYTLTRVSSADVGLSEVSDFAFLPCSPKGENGIGSDTQDPGKGYTDDGLSVLLPIGFDFQLDGITYKNFVACTNGWMSLVDPSTGTFNHAEVLLDNILINSGIRPTFTTNAVLLAPWFDDLKNVSDALTETNGALSATKINRIVTGLEPPIALYNSVEYGVKYFIDQRSTKGRRLIVRWNSLSNFGSATAQNVLRFEVVLYENGNIEFRYAKPSRAFVPQAGESATVGIFMPGAANRFRDFSAGLGYRDSARTLYTYGGYTNSSNTNYTDPGSGVNGDIYTGSYSCNLTPSNNWPTTALGAAAFIFQAPKRRRKVLPRLNVQLAGAGLTLPTISRTGDERLGSSVVLFDDRRTMQFILSGTVTGSVTGSGVVNFPTSLPRFYGGLDPLVAERQDLFSNDFEMSASISYSAADAWVGGSVSKQTLPFSENKRFEQAYPASSYFLTGTSITQVGQGLSAPLRSKTQIRMSLAVEYNTTLLPTASVLMYYNARAKAWEVPQNSSYIISATGTGNDSGVAKGDFASPSDFSQNNCILEDARGFGPMGNSVSSGTNGSFPRTAGSQSDFYIGSSASFENINAAVTRVFPKSVQVNPDYSAAPDELFSLPISQPFLIEKAVIEVPMSAGDGWFKSLTTSFMPLELQSTSSFDFAGPALTVALFNQVKSGNGTRLDLIMTGTITHTFDNSNNLVISNFPPTDWTYQLRPVGFLAYSGPPAAVVMPNSSSAGYSFTGSVAMQCAAGVSNGVSIKYIFVANSSSYYGLSGTVSQFQTAMRNFLSQPKIALGNNTPPSGPGPLWTTTSQIAYVNVFGRGASGFDPSGRSMFGKEFTAFNGFDASNLLANPFYISGSNPNQTGAASDLPAQMEQAISQGLQWKACAVLPLESSQPSPYLVYPGDKLVLAVSKMRPAFYGTQAAAPYTSGSIIDDVQLITGSVNITLYGSMLRNNVEFHDVSNAPLASNAVHELILGNDFLLDQLEGEYRDGYFGSLSDNYLTGTMVTKTIGANNQVTLTIGNRGRVFSKLLARSAPTTQTTNQENLTNPSKAYRLQPWFERKGSIRTVKFTDNTERIWDSMMPSVSDCFAADGCGIFITSTQYGLTTSNLVADYKKVDQTPKSPWGWIAFDYQQPSLIVGGQGPGINPNWSKAYPYEPRYTKASRQNNIAKSFLATYLFTGGSPLMMPIAPVLLSGFMFGTTTIVAAGAGIFNGITYVADANIAGTNFYGNFATGSASVDDMSRALFGFGDTNSCMNFNNGDGTFSLLGTNHGIGWRDYEADGFIGGGSLFVYSPTIRGWKYGVFSGLPAYNNAYFRRGRFGQLRDMLEQRLYTKFYQIPDATQGQIGQSSVSTSPIKVRFVDASGKTTLPENTLSQNLSFEATSSVPYFDGEVHNRPPINNNTINTNVVVLRTNTFGDITL